MVDLPVLDDRRPMEEVVAGLATKSAKIRELDKEGYSRSEIAKYLGIRYQHAYNVLKQSKPDQVPKRLWTTIGPGGRVVIPAAHRRALGLREGDDVQLRLETDQVCVIGRSAVIRRVQERVAQYVQPGRSLVDELIAERRREAAREDAGE